VLVLVSLTAATDCSPLSLHDALPISGETLPVGVSRMAVTAAIRELGGLSLREVREAYVGAFDLKDRTGLYLTAHELGDSRKRGRSEEHTSELQSRENLVCRLLLEKKK